MAYTNRVCTEVVKARKQQWLTKMLGNRARAARGHYRAQWGWKQDPVLAAAPKKLASRFYQLKPGHAAIRPYLQRIGARESKRCQGARPLRNQSAISYWNAGNGGGLGKTWPKPYGKRG
jgi:hypothetical protein